MLFRTSAQAKAIEEALSRAGIPYAHRGGEAISARPAVAALIEALRALPPDAPDASPRPVSEVVLQVAAAEPSPDPARTRAADLLAALALPFSHDLPRFLDTIPTLHEVDAHLERQKVALLTMHAAKGLEFALVFVVGCDDGLVPLRLPGAEVAQEDLEEERRILYVGMTRAKRRLVLMSAARRSLFGRTLEHGPCPFLAAVPSQWLVRSRAPARRRRPRQMSLF